MNPPLWQLIYTSHATDTFSEAELGAILAASHANNPAQGLTGILLYSDGRFIQVLEGERGPVETLYERIKADPRHETVRRVMTREIAQRDFADWSMGYRSLTAADLASPPQLLDFFAGQFSADGFGKAGSPARFLLMAFRDVA